MGGLGRKENDSFSFCLVVETKGEGRNTDYVIIFPPGWEELLTTLINRVLFSHRVFWNNKGIQPLRFKIGHIFGVKLLWGLEKMGGE